MALTNTTQDGVIVPDPGFPSVTEPLITKTPGVCGGRACIAGRRIPVWSLVESKHIGISDERLLTDFDPNLSVAELNAAWDYAETHSEEIESDIRENDIAGDEYA